MGLSMIASISLHLLAVLLLRVLTMLLRLVLPPQVLLLRLLSMELLPLQLPAGHRLEKVEKVEITELVKALAEVGTVSINTTGFQPSFLSLFSR
jgi:hypothetical protein